VGALYDYGEVLFCIIPVFVIIGGIGAMLAWNSLPDRGKEKKNAAKSKNDGPDERI